MSKAAFQIIENYEKVIEEYENLLASIYLYIGWKYVTKQLTTPQKEMFAAAVVEVYSKEPYINDVEQGVDHLDLYWWREQ